jgi:hypothetical protein
VRRFKKSKKAWKEFPNQVAIQVSAPSAFCRFTGTGN